MLSESAVLLLGTNPKGAGEIGWGVGNRSLGHNKFIIAKKKKKRNKLKYAVKDLLIIYCTFL